MVEERGRITSRQNPVVKNVRSLTQKKNREISGCFMVEGIRLLEEAAQAARKGSRFQMEMVIFSTDALVNKRTATLIQLLASEGVETKEVSPDVMDYMSDTTSPSGILGVVRNQTAADSPPDIINQKETEPLILILDALQDPGNLGTLLRTAEAAGVTEVWTTPGTVDCFSPKVVRATMGSIFRIPVRTDVTPAQIAELLPSGSKLFGTAGGRGTPYYQTDFTGPMAVVLGSEAEGLSSQMEEMITDWVHIPMAGLVDSLNVAVAGALVLFEIVRQHRLLEHDFRDVL